MRGRSTCVSAFAATQAFGLATPLGINSTTGFAGLCLGGGFGWLTRKHGMTIDNLLSADLIAADGSYRVVSAANDPDLFWALRGGGGNFGVVTSFEIALHPVGPLVHAGLVIYPASQVREVLRGWRDFTETAPDELSVWAVIRKAPPLPFLAPEVHGTGARNYWKTSDSDELDDDAIDVFVDAARSIRGPECEVFIAQLGGAMARVPSDATAYAGRDARYIMNVHGRWRRPEDDGTIRAWARRMFEETAPFATGGAYVNFLTEDESSRVVSAYGSNYERLREVKERIDPDNLFRMNHNIPPCGCARVGSSVRARRGAPGAA